MPTVAEIISDVELALYQGAVSDDAETDRQQIKFWASYHLNQLVATEVNSKLAKGEMVPPIYIKRTEIEVAEQEEEDDVDAANERIFVTLDVDILDCNKDSGIIQIVTDEGDEVKKVDIQTLQQVKHLRFAKPSLENLLYYRQENKLYISGFKAVDLPFNKLFVFYIPKQNLLTMAETDEVAVSALVLPALIAATVESGKQQILGSQADLESDGTEKTQPVYHQQIKNPNA